MPVWSVMLVKVPKPISETHVEELRARLYRTFGEDWFLVFDSEQTEDAPFTQLQEDEFDAPDGNYNNWLNLNLTKCAYRPGYERGNPWDYIALAYWIEYNIEGALVYYGSDESDNQIRFDEEARQKLIEHFCKHGYDPYRNR